MNINQLRKLAISTVFNGEVAGENEIILDLDKMIHVEFDDWGKDQIMSLKVKSLKNQFLLNGSLWSGGAFSINFATEKLQVHN